MIALEVKDIRKKFGSHQVLKGVNFTIEGPELVGLIGPNGAGKTTLTNVLDGAIKPNLDYSATQQAFVNGDVGVNVVGTWTIDDFIAASGLT